MGRWSRKRTWPDMDRMLERMITRATGIRCAAVLVAASVAGCSGVGDPLEAIGARVPPPDEFEVIASAPLQMPSSRELPRPRVGEPSPLAPNPQADAARALIGSANRQIVGAGAPSQGEQILLSSANASADSSDIRVQLERERIEDESNKPYEPPSIFELFGGGDGNADPDAIDPVAESQRLQQTGVRSPSDPAAVAPEPEAEKAPPVESYYPRGRPQNKIVFEGTGPKF